MLVKTSLSGDSGPIVDVDKRCCHIINTVHSCTVNIVRKVLHERKSRQNTYGLIQISVNIVCHDFVTTIPLSEKLCLNQRNPLTNHNGLTHTEESNQCKYCQEYCTAVGASNRCPYRQQGRSQRRGGGGQSGEEIGNNQPQKNRGNQENRKKKGKLGRKWEACRELAPAEGKGWQRP